ncbi:MAG TPA: hypothetical protein VGB53_13845 [Rubricoccaceae bacterium]
MLPARLAAVAVLAVLAGCDLPTDPVPTNPYDPLFDGARIATSPEGVTITGSTPTAVSIAWTDRSSFETGVQVQRALGVGSFSTIATLSPDATSYTDTGLNPTGPDGTADRRYRVIALGDGGRPSVPSDTLTIRFPVDVVGYTVPGLTGQGGFSDDGGTLFATGLSTLFVSNTVTGDALATLTAVRGLLSRLGGARVLITESTTGPDAAVRIYDRQTQQSRRTLFASGPNGCISVAPLTIRASADLQTFVGLCATSSPDRFLLAVWGPDGGQPVRAVVLPGTRALALDLALDGTHAVVSSASTVSANREVTGIDVVSGTVLWTARDVAPADLPLLFSPDSRSVLDASTQAVRIRDAATGTVQAERREITSRPAILSFSPDGQQVAIVYSGTLTTVVSRTSDLSIAIRLDRTRTGAFQLLNGGRAIGFRGSETSNTDSEVVRWDFARSWVAVQP